MKVLLVGRPDRGLVSGGDTVQLEETARGLAAYGVQARVAASADEVAEAGRYALVHFFHLPAIDRRAVQRVRQAGVPVVISPIFWNPAELWFHLARARPGVWQMVGWIAGARAGRRLHASRQRAKATRRQDWLDQQWIVEAADALLPNSQIEADHLVAYFRLNRELLRPRVFVIPNGITPSSFEDLAGKARRFQDKYGLSDFVLEVARVEPAKNQLLVIEALSSLDLPLVFIGKDSPYHPDYVATCKRLLAARKNGVFLGEMPREDVVGAYAAALVHVLPSWRETPGLASLEAAAAGCRVVSTVFGSAPEYFGDLARYCDAGDIGSIRAAVQQALERPPDDRLRQRVLDQFTWQRAAERTFAAYRRVLEQR